MKKIIALAVAVTAAIFALPSVFGAEAPVYGDANGDSVLTVSDVTAVQKHIAKIEILSDERLSLSKVSGNDVLTIIDATLIQKKLANLIDKFPAEDKKDTLVAVFSRTGNTKPLAQYAAEYLDADFFEIEAAVPYTDADIAYYTNLNK